MRIRHNHIKKRNLIKTILLILIIPIIIYELINIVVFKSYKSYPAELVNFNPDKNLVVNTNKPIYYYSEKKFYFSPNGNIKLSNPIWSGEIDERFYDDKVSVSPNSKYIVICHKSGIDIIDYKGNKICQFKQETTELEDKNKTNYYLNEYFQWDSNSENLYLKKIKSRVGISSTCSLIKLNINTRKLINIYDFQEESWRIYLNKNEEFFYYTAYDNKNDKWILKEVNFATKKITNTILTDNKFHLITTEKILANLNCERDSGYKNDNIIGESLDNKNMTSNIYSTTKKGEKMIFEVKVGNDEFKGRKLGVIEFNNNVYLPDNFFMTQIYSKNYEGTIVINLNTLKYNFYDTEVKPYYASEIKENKDLKYITGELLFR